MRKIVFIFSLASIFCSCKRDYTVPKDFNFSLSFGFWGDEINTFDSTFETGCKLDSTGWGDTVVKVIFTKEEMNQIYHKMIDNDYLDLPDTFKAKSYIMPHQEYRLTVNANSRKKLIRSNSDDNIDIKNSQKFDSITEEILKILYSKKEVKNLPPDNRIAL